MYDNQQQALILACMTSTPFYLEVCPQQYEVCPCLIQLPLPYNFQTTFTLHLPYTTSLLHLLTKASAPLLFTFSAHLLSHDQKLKPSMSYLCYLFRHKSHFDILPDNLISNFVAPSTPTHIYLNKIISTTCTF